MDCFYILSTGRAGSTFLARTLEHAMDDQVNLHQSPRSRLVSILANLDLALGTALAAGFATQTTHQSTVDPQASIYLYQRLHRRSDDGVKVVHLVRDPRDFITSMMNWKDRRLQSKISHHVIPWWSPSPVFHGVSLADYLRMSKFEQFAWTWRFKNELFGSTEQLGVPYLRVKTEEITTDPNALAQIASFIGMGSSELIAPSEQTNASAKRTFPTWRNWTKEQRQIVKRHCGELMEDYGYGYESEWLAQ